METFSALLAICAGNSPVSPVNSPHKGQWRGALMFSLICIWTNDWVVNREAGDLRRYHANYDVIVMQHRPPHPFWMVNVTALGRELFGVLCVPSLDGVSIRATNYDVSIKNSLYQWHLTLKKYYRYAISSIINETGRFIAIADLTA